MSTIDLGKPSDQQGDHLEDHVSYARQLFGALNLSHATVKQKLLERGLTEEEAVHVIARARGHSARPGSSGSGGQNHHSVQQSINEARRVAGQRDMLFGALWCVGGIIATAADIGYIFWGAIVFGAIQFIRGAIKLN